jgi:hypothetical protein
MTSLPEAHDVVQDVSGEEAPPDDEGKDQGQGSGRWRGGFDGPLLSPANPVGWQQRQPDGDEVLLEVEESKRLPMTRALQIGPNVDAEGHVKNGAQ